MRQFTNTEASEELCGGQIYLMLFNPIFIIFTFPENGFYGRVPKIITASIQFITCAWEKFPWRQIHQEFSQDSCP